MFFLKYPLQNVDKADNKKDKFFRYICLILKQSFIYKEDWSKFFI